MIIDYFLSSIPWAGDRSALGAGKTKKPLIMFANGCIVIAGPVLLAEAASFVTN